MADSSAVSAQPGDPPSNALSKLPDDRQPNIDIAGENGDVILVLPNARLRVSSVILSSASPVFKTMLGPNFAEGQAPRSVQNPKEISLADDDAEVMERLCRLIHHQRETLDPFRTDLGRPEYANALFFLILMADKYDCIVAIEGTAKSAVGYLTQPHMLPSLCEEALLALAAASYLLDCEYFFAKTTRRLILAGDSLLSSFAEHPAMAVLPSSFLILANEQRAEAWEMVHYRLLELADQSCYRYGCGARAVDRSFPEMVLGNYAHGSTGVSILSIILQVNKRADVAIYLRTGCKHQDNYRHYVAQAKLEAWCKRVNIIVCGLCLECLRDSAESCCHKGNLQTWASYDFPV